MAKEELTNKERLDLGWLHCTTIIEILGKPKEYIEQTLRDFVKDIKENKVYKVIREEYLPPEPKEETLFTAFVELEMWVKGVGELVFFCFDYMPSSVEIIEPESIMYKNRDLTSFLNDLQAKLHGIDMIVKQVTHESSRLQQNTKRLLWNIVTLVLQQKDSKIEEIAPHVGIPNEKLEPFLKDMEEAKLIVKKGNLYSIAKK